MTGAIEKCIYSRTKSEKILVYPKKLPWYHSCHVMVAFHGFAFILANTTRVLDLNFK